MKKQLIFLLFFIGSAACYSALSLSSGYVLPANFRQEMGIPISQADFDGLLNKFTTIMVRGDSITNIHDYFSLARLENTIYYGDLSKIEKYKKMTDLYAGRYAMATISRLEAAKYRGQYFYSKKYDIYLGGPMNNNSVFKINR